MSYDSTTAIPENDGRKGILKQSDLTNSSTYPSPLWDPVNNKRVIIDDIILSLREKSAKRIVVELQILKNTAWETIAQLGTLENGFVYFDHAFAGKIASDKGPGNKVRIRKLVTSNSTSFDLKVMLIGREV